MPYIPYKDCDKYPEPRLRCRASRGDGECNWAGCPQLRDNEPATSGRHCPRDFEYEDEDY